MCAARYGVGAASVGWKGEGALTGRGAARTLRGRVVRCSRCVPLRAGQTRVGGWAHHGLSSCGESRVHRRGESAQPQIRVLGRKVGRSSHYEYWRPQRPPARAPRQPDHGRDTRGRPIAKAGYRWELARKRRATTATTPRTWALRRVRAVASAAAPWPSWLRVGSRRRRISWRTSSGSCLMAAGSYGRRGESRRGPLRPQST